MKSNSAALFLSLVFISSIQAAQPLHRRHVLFDFDPAGRKQIPVLFLDADSTLRIAPSGSVSANSATDYMILPFVPEVLKEYSDQGYFLAIVSNQAGVGKKYVKLRDSDQALFNMILELRQAGASVHYMDYATRSARDRKPDIGMARRIEFLFRAKYGKDVSVDKANSMMVGDADWKIGETKPDGNPGQAISNSDRLFASNYGIKFVSPEAFFHWQNFGVSRIDSVDAYRTFAEKLRPSCEILIQNLRNLALTRKN